MEKSAPSAPRLPAGSQAFRERLLSIMDRKDHSSYWRLMGPGATREQLLVHYLQEWEVYVRDFPIFLSRVHARCPVASVRRDLAENLYEEETGRISGGGPHGELFLHMMSGLGFGRERFGRAQLLPASWDYRRFIDEATARGSWLVGLAVATIFVEGSRNDRAEIDAAPGASRETPARRGSLRRASLRRDPLVIHHGLDPRYLELKRVHRKVEGGHRLSAWRAVLEHARTPRDRVLVASALDRALVLWVRYRDGVALAAGL
jgi:hypothetical protein